MPRAVIVLVSALQFHRIGTHRAHSVNILLRNNAVAPRTDYPPIEVFKSGIEAAFTEGIEIHRLNDIEVPVTDPARTVVDCFKYRSRLGLDLCLEALKEVLRSREHLVKPARTILTIQATLEQNEAGFRKLPGTTLKNERTGEIVSTPPQNYQQIESAMRDLESFINNPVLSPVDPLVKMALIHHRFESIHPFYDGTGRILNVLYLVKENLLAIPTLYLSRYILQTKSDYYRLLQTVRTDEKWEEWILYLLTAIEITARQTIDTIARIGDALQDYKHRIRKEHRFYSQDPINNLFTHPYTKIEVIVQDLKVSRVTATRYLDELCATGFLKKRKIGRTNYYLNLALTEILSIPPNAR